MAKVQNEALENELDDCKAECRASDGCLAFIQKPDGVCINLKFVDKSRCAKDQEGFNLFYNGECFRFALYRLFQVRIFLIIRLPVRYFHINYLSTNKINETYSNAITYIYFLFSMVQ